RQGSPPSCLVGIGRRRVPERQVSAGSPAGRGRLLGGSHFPARLRRPSPRPAGRMGGVSAFSSALFYWVLRTMCWTRRAFLYMLCVGVDERKSSARPVLRNERQPLARGPFSTLRVGLRGPHGSSTACPCPRVSDARSQRRSPREGRLGRARVHAGHGRL